MAYLPRMRKLRIDADLYYMEKAMARGHYYGSGEPVNENGIIAYVRHNYTNYESILGQLFGLTGGGLAYQVIRQRVDKEIRLRLGLADASAAATGQEAGVPTPVAECDSTRQGGNRQ
ncbi:MAG: hypothetical protein GX616_02545 [Planctomycetes bacterium]|nr:hypothetical protein [Planctomycetota bacterium]